MAVAGLVIIGLGAALVIVGAIMLIVEWVMRLRGHPGHPGIETKPTAAAAQMTALRKLLKELRNHPLGTQFIVWGILLILIGGALDGVSTL